jgi:preprotein translocase subunit SecF
MKTNNKIIPFFSKRWIYFTISISIMVIGTLFAIFEGVQLDIAYGLKKARKAPQFSKR